ncbi:hypothetical protein LTS12_027462, partial [Elasticomyces elasticus]
YIDQSPAAANFTDRLLTTVREQRHIETQVIISTQEPTISEKLLDLCSISIVHHSKSPAWFRSIRNHLGGASGPVNSDREQATLFEQIGTLPVGESRVFAPSAFVCLGADGQVQIDLRSAIATETAVGGCCDNCLGIGKGWDMPVKYLGVFFCDLAADKKDCRIHTKTRMSHPAIDLLLEIE